MRYNELFVISAVNIINGGPFTVLKDCVEVFSEIAKKDSIKLVVLVNSKDNFSDIENVEFLEYPNAKKNYLYRFFYEYVYFFFLSLKLKPKYWLSLHDMTPNVVAKNRYVYMHNPSPFYRHEKGEELSRKFYLFTKFYKYIYKINSKHNTSIIVQQKWMKEAIAKLCKYRLEKIIVATPTTEPKLINSNYEENLFFYPAYPRDFKNFEVICEANRILENEFNEVKPWKIVLTFDGKENTYSKKLYDEYACSSRHIEYVGLLPIEKVYEYYNRTKCLIFPSKLETWGLPISEFKNSNKYMLLADLPYAHESSNGALNVAFFNYNDAHTLAKLIDKVINDNFNDFKEEPHIDYDGLYANNWTSLYFLLTRGNLK